MTSCIVKHDYVETVYSGRGVVRAKRSCRKCSKAQTLMHDYTLNDTVWVDGDFAKDEPECVFIFSATKASFVKEVTKLEKELSSKHAFFWMESDLDWRHIANHRHPTIWLADDWLESEAIKNPRFRLLVAVGHL